MDALYYIVISIFVLICIMLVVVILLQSSQTGGMGSGISGNAFNAAFGGQGADKLLVKITTVLAVLFMSFAIILNVLPTPGSVITKQGQMSTAYTGPLGTDELVEPLLPSEKVEVPIDSSDE